MQQQKMFHSPPQPMPGSQIVQKWWEEKERESL